MCSVDRSVYDRIAALASTPEALNKTAEYIAGQLRLFVKRQDRVLVCFPAKEPQDLGSLFSEAIRRVDGIPVIWEGDLRWKTLLRMAFSQRAVVMIAPPLVVLGLSKLAKATGTSLNIRNVVTAGYPCSDWMIDGIIKGLDCGTWGCFGPGIGPVVSGFSCGKSRGVHIRDSEYEVNVFGQGNMGEIAVSDKSLPGVSLKIPDRGRLESTACPCGNPSVRLMDIGSSSRLGPDLEELYQQLHAWTSILDCRLKKGQCGLEMEMIVFPGQKLPKLPTCAKMIIRAWNPDLDEPFALIPEWEKWENTSDSH